MTEDSLIFSQRIKEALNIRRFSQKEAAKAINVTQRTMSEYVNGKMQPTAPAIIKLAKFLDVSADYLLGLTDEFTPLTREEDPLKEEIETIRSVYAKLSVAQRQAMLALFRSLDR